MENQSRAEIAIQILEIANRENSGEDKKTGNMQTAICIKRFSASQN